MNKSACSSINTLVAIALLTGCTAIKTKTNPASPEKADFGIPYFLPDSLIQLTIKKVTEIDAAGIPLPGKSPKYSLSADTKLIPDTSNQYIMQAPTNVLASDRLCVSRSTTGLLQSVQFATDDKTDEILVKLAELAAKVGKTMTGFGTPATPPKEETVIALGNPYDKAALLPQIQTALPEIDDLEFTNLPAKTPRTCPEHAVCFSTLKSVPVFLKTKGVNVATAIAQVVDIEHVGKLEVNRPFLAQQVTKIGFKDGVLTSLSVKKPSEGLALASLPLDILNVIMGVPANFFATALGGTFSDQKALLENQKALVELQKSIRDAQTNSGSEASETDASFKLECVSLDSKPQS
ncbi:MAG: hypothetical protein NTV43_00905 [Methylococcales bacterium]|nr:hypothetical protein [Methylococcales bacterium]